MLEDDVQSSEHDFAEAFLLDAVHIVEDAIEGSLDFNQSMLQRVLRESQIFFTTTVCLEFSQNGGPNIHPRQDIGKATGDFLAELHAPTQSAHGDIG